MTRRFAPVLFAVLLVASALVGIASQQEPAPRTEAPVLYPKVLNELRPPEWPESFPTLSNIALIEANTDPGKSWVLTSPGEYLATTLAVTEAFKAAGYTGPRAISVTDSTYIGKRSKEGDRVAIRIDQIGGERIPSGWVVLRITYIQAPKDLEKADLSGQM